MSATASLITGVDFVSVPTRDLAAAMTFYGEDAEPSSLDVHRGQPFAEFETGSLTIGVIESEKMASSTRQTATTSLCTSMTWRPHRAALEASA